MFPCQRCGKQSTLHITQIDPEGQILEIHLCEEHARQLGPSTPQAQGASAEAAAPAGAAAAAPHPMLEKMDARTCPLCGISFREFRSSGRLGCPHDYEAFGEELLPLLESIHGNLDHRGKTPRRAESRTGRQDELMRLRLELRRAVAGEDYEGAARLRDQIKELGG